MSMVVRFPKGTMFAKGFTGAYNTNTLKNSRYFYVTHNHDTALKYRRKSNKGIVHYYKTTRPIRLLRATPDAIKRVLKQVNSQRYRNILTFAFGRHPNKRTLIKSITKDPQNHANAWQGNRVSLHHVNKEASSILCRLPGIDGYYFKGDDRFHQEVMICDARGLFVHRWTPQKGYENNGKPLKFEGNSSPKRAPSVNSPAKNSSASSANSSAKRNSSVKRNSPVKKKRGFFESLFSPFKKQKTSA